MKKSVALATKMSRTYGSALKLASGTAPDLEKIAALLIKADRAGDLRAAYALATWHLYGHGPIRKNIKNAVALLKQATKGDVAAAHFDLAVLYETGTGVRRSEQQAYRHYLAAALNGDDSAYSEVGRCLYHGIGIERDKRAAEIWFRRAERLGVQIR